MKITFLGTGTSQGIPLIACNCDVCKSKDQRDKRLRTSILVETENQTIVVDTGPDFRQQMLNNNVEKLDAVIFTHEHKDHTAGLDDIRAFNYKQRRKIPIYATERVQQNLKESFAYIFAENRYPGIPEIELITISQNNNFSIGDLNITPILVKHLKLPVLGFRFDKVVFITDANFISDEELAKTYGAEILVLNALKKEKHISHYSLNEAIDLAVKTKIPKVFFVHMSHEMGFHADINKELPSGFELAFDGLVLEI